MKRKSLRRPPVDFEPVPTPEEEVEETDVTLNDDDELYSDEFLDSFMRAEPDEDDSYSFSFRESSSEADDDFDSFFREADGYSHVNRPRRRRSRGRRARESFELDYFEPFDRRDWRSSNGRRPRR